MVSGHMADVAKGEPEVTISWHTEGTKTRDSGAESDDKAGHRRDQTLPTFLQKPSKVKELAENHDISNVDDIDMAGERTPACLQGSSADKEPADSQVTTDVSERFGAEGMCHWTCDTERLSCRGIGSGG